MILLDIGTSQDISFRRFFNIGAGGFRHAFGGGTASAAAPAQGAGHSVGEVHEGVVYPPCYFWSKNQPGRLDNGRGIWFN